VSSNEYLNYAMKNRQSGKKRVRREVVAEMLDKYGASNPMKAATYCTCRASYELSL
jgi:hypothetical protein